MMYELLKMCILHVLIRNVIYYIYTVHSCIVSFILKQYLQVT